MSRLPDVLRGTPAVTRTAVAALLLFAGALTRSLVDGFGLQDESWFLQVVDRGRSGDALYRDVWLGVTPLSVYVTTAVSFFTGIEVLAVKTVTAACVAAAGVFAWRLGAVAGVPSRRLWWIVPIVIVYGRPFGAPPYTAMAMALLLATAECALRHLRAADPVERRKWLAIGGVIAGLTFAAKQNLGGLAWLVLVAAVAISVRDRRIPMGSATRDLFRVTTFAGLTALVLLAPVFIAGGGPAFFDYAFASKTAYVEIGRVSYVGEVRAWISDAFDGLAVGSLARAYHSAILVLPVVVAAAGVSLVRRAPAHRPVAMFLIVVALCGLAAAIPRWDRFHLAYAVPAAAVVVLYALAGVPRTAAVTLVARVGAIWLTAGLGLFAAGSVARLTSADLTWSALPHFRWTRVDRSTLGSLTDTAAALRHAAAAGPVLVVTPEAGALYLMSGIRNATPFDLPAVTSTGRGGAAALAGAVANGQFASVCLDEHDTSRQALVAVRDAVHRLARQRQELPRCHLFTLEPAATRR